MYSGQNIISNNVDNNDYDFEKADNASKWKGTFLISLRKVLEQVHPSLSVGNDALTYLECLCLRLLGMLCAKPPPHTIQDIEERIGKTFPTPIDKWALNEARETIDKSKKKKTVLPAERIHSMLQKEVLQYKIDSSVALYLAAVLEYISADILKLAGNYVKNFKHVEISKQDIKVAMNADKALMDMFQSDADSITPKPIVSTPLTNLNYEDLVKEFIHDEKQYQRDLHMIIRVFREELSRIANDTKELDEIFSNINDIYEVTVTLLGSLDDVIEMSEERMPICVGSCFEELAEAAEFDVYIKYARDITSMQSREALQNLLMKQDAAKLISAGHGFREAVKFYLPKLLLGPISHVFLYLDYVNHFLNTSPNVEDKEIFEQVQGLLKPLQCELESIVATLPKNYRELMVHTRRHTRRQSAIEKIKELQNIVEHWDNAGQCCNEFITEDTLQKLSSGKRITERKVYLFDGLLVLCKSNTRRQGVTTAVVGGASNFDFRLKERFFMRKVEVIDRPDTDDIKHSFEIAPRSQQPIVLIAKNVQHKNDWMADLIMVNTKSMLDRILDSILLDIEKKHPLRLPSPDIYKFSVPDNPTNIVFDDNADNTGVPTVKGATIHKLIERLTYHIHADPKFVRQFLTTFRTFSTPTELLQLLIERFNIPDFSLVYESNCDTNNSNEIGIFDGGGINCGNSTIEKSLKNYQREDWKRYKKEYVQPVQFRVLNALRHWVDHHFYDFEANPTLLESLLQFLESINGKTMRKWVDSVLKIIQRKKEQTENHKQITFAFGHSPPPIEHHMNVPDNEMTLLTIHPLELARQLTLLQSELFRTVKPCEVVDSVWTKEDKDARSPNLLKMIKFTDEFARYIVELLLETENFEERSAVLIRAVEVVVALYELNNFNAVIVCAGGLASTPIFRLKLTFSTIPARYEKQLIECLELAQNHYRKYIERLRSVNPPCVPFFGMYLTHIVHTEEGNPNYLPNTTLINFAKRRKVADITAEIQQFQNQPYCLSVDNKIRNFLISLKPFENIPDIDQHLYSSSMKIEPRHVKLAPKFWGAKVKQTLKYQSYKQPRRWPDLTLKSPGIKPRRQNQLNSSTNNKITTGTSESEQSPPGTLTSLLDYSLFTNSMNVQNNHDHSLSQSELNLNTFTSASSPCSNDSVGGDFSYKPSLSSAAPELPKRSNSISLSQNTSNIDFTRPILSPRTTTTGNDQNTTPTNFYNGQSLVVSPMAFGSLTEDRHVIGTPADCNIFKGNISYGYQGSNMDHRLASSPNMQNSVNPLNVFQQPPGSPHVNVFSNIITDPETINQIIPTVTAPPPPLPPRRERKESAALLVAQSYQTADAPQLPPRDISPPPLPPRLGLIQTPKLKESDTFEHSLMLPNTSTIMKRRAQNSLIATTSQLIQGTTIVVTPTSYIRGGNNSNNFQDPNVCNNTSNSTQNHTNDSNKFNTSNELLHFIDSSTSSLSGTGGPIPPAHVKKPNVSPRFSPCDAIPVLPPKPKHTNLIAQITDKMTMFPYPSTNPE